MNILINLISIVSLIIAPHIAVNSGPDHVVPISVPTSKVIGVEAQPEVITNVQSNSVK